MELRRRPAAQRRRPRVGGAAPAPEVAAGAAPSPEVGMRLPTTMGGTRAGGGPRGPDAARIVEILSHELRSPITTIHLGTKVLRGAGREFPAPVRNEVVAAVEEEAERLHWLVEDLLAVARHDAGSAPLPAGPLLLQHWLPSILDAEVRADPRLRVRMALAAHLPPVAVDDAALAQVVRNLLRNAARYAGDGMPVEIIARPPGPGFVTLEVLDRGPGVDAEDAERVFEPFYRSAAAGAIGSGAGLGLAAARSLLGAMGGTIQAVERLGGGARFVIRLPLASADDDAERA